MSEPARKRVQLRRIQSDAKKSSARGLGRATTGTAERFRNPLNSGRVKLMISLAEILWTAGSENIPFSFSPSFGGHSPLHTNAASKAREGGLAGWSAKGSKIEVDRDRVALGRGHFDGCGIADERGSGELQLDGGSGENARPATPTTGV